ncbi:AAA family ATPase [Caldifermentibacillus hisashii]|uniref:AAA family ATPase n=1 Tax=Caldifermentibacillus hisashii TaxID=996558 RepID=UPI00343F8B48
MKLHSLHIKGFRRHYESNIYFSDATFLIGSNNVGKSSIFKALDYLLNDKRKMDDADFFQILNDNNENEKIASTVEITGVFRDVPHEAEKWMGFNKQRLFQYEVDTNSKETGLQIHYRKTFTSSGQCKIEMKQKGMVIKEQYSACKTLNDLIEAGLNNTAVDILFCDKPKTTKINQKVLIGLQDLNVPELEELFDIDQSEEIWFENPGGIPGNVLSRLPKFLLIPDIAKTETLSGKKGALIDTLSSLFEDVRNASENFKNAQYYLNELAKELDPNDEDSEFHRLIKELNRVVSDVFPNAFFNAQANLSDATQVIEPQFDVSLGSNIHTDVNNQGAGVIRSAIFALLRYRSMRENRKRIYAKEYVKPLIIAFEEPEIYLHPKAAQQMRETIYELASDKNNQIIATTHSPYMIDLGKSSSQILNSFHLKERAIEKGGERIPIEYVKINPFNVSDSFKKLMQNERDFLKMLIKIDDSVAKIFFAKHVLIVEGDTEEVVLKESIERLPEEFKNEVIYDWEIIKARGKATIISLVKYLKAMGIDPWVIHDMDNNNPNAKNFNRPILEAIGSPNRRFMLENCIEDILGYKPPTKDKPYAAYKYIINNWTSEWKSLPQKWRNILENIFFGKNQDESTNLLIASTVDNEDNNL